MSFILKQIPKAFSGISQRKIKILKSFYTSIGERRFSPKSLDEFTGKYIQLAFTQADKDKDGQISADEWKDVVKMFFKAKGKPMSPVASSFFDTLIFHDNKKVSQEELTNRINHGIKFLMQLGEEIMKTKFEKHDVDKDGKLNKEEVGNLLEEMYPISSKDQADSFISKYDQDKDGMVTYEELLAFAKKELFNVKI